MNDSTQLIMTCRTRAHTYGLFITGRYRDLVSTDETRSLVDLSLVKASKRFDETRGVPFFFYARVWIKLDLTALVRQRMTHRERFSPVLGTISDLTSTSRDGDVLVKQLINKLNEEEQHIVREHVLKGQSLAELARHKRRHRAWACRLLKRALGRLRPFVAQAHSFENARPGVRRRIHHAIADTEVTP